MDELQRVAQLDDDQEQFALGLPSLLETWKHHSKLLTHELDETSRELGGARHRIAQLVVMHGNDQERLRQQERRIKALESQVRQLKDTAMAAMSHGAASQSVAIYQGAYKGI
jgi:phage shock protein A